MIRYQKGKTNLDLPDGLRDSEWQRRHMGHTQIYTSPQTDNHGSTQPLSFYPHDAMLARAYATAFPCVCVTRVLCIKTAQHFMEILSPPDSPIILVFRYQGSLLNSDGFIPNGGIEYKMGEQIGQFLNNKLVYLGNGARYGHSCYRSRIGNHTKLSNGGSFDELE